MWEDPIVAETRAIRDIIAKRFGYDAKALGEHFKAMSLADLAALVDDAARSTPPSDPYSTTASLRPARTTE